MGEQVLAVNDPGRYRFSALRRSGLFGTIPPSLLVTLGVGVVGGWLGVLAQIPLPIALIPVGSAGVIGFGRLRGRPIHAVIPGLIGWWCRRLAGRHSWSRPVPLVTNGVLPGVLPKVFSGIEIGDVDVPVGTAGHGGPVGVVRDRSNGTISATIRVCGDGQFALSDPTVQDSRIELWGAALAGFCREHGAVCRVTWRDWSTPRS